MMVVNPPPNGMDPRRFFISGKSRPRGEGRFFNLRDILFAPMLTVIFNLERGGVCFWSPEPERNRDGKERVQYLIEITLFGDFKER